MKKFFLFALFCSLSLATFAGNVAIQNLEIADAEQVLLSEELSADATIVAVNFMEETCTVKTKTTITDADGNTTTIESETTVNMSCAELVRTAIKAVKE